MKKTYILMLITAFLTLILASNLTSATALMNDSFEDGNVSRWTSEGSTITSANNTNQISGTYSLWFRQGGANGKYDFRNFTTQNTNTTISLSVKLYSVRPTFFISDGGDKGFINSHYIRCFAGIWEYYDGNPAYHPIGLACVAPNIYNFTILIHSFGADSKADYRINGVGMANNTDSRGVVNDIFSIGISSYTANNADMYDNILVCPGTWNTSCIGAPPPPAPNYFQINLTDEDDTTAILNFTATLNGTTYGTKNGSITTNVLNNASINLSINISSNHSGGYFDRDFYYNVSSSLVTTLYQTITSLTALEKITNNTLTGTFFRNGTEINITSQHFRAGNYIFKFSNNSYFNKTLNVYLPALFNGTLNITEVYNTELNIYIRNAYSNQSLNNFSGWIYNQANLYNTTHTATPGNVSQTGLIQGLNYTIYAEHPGYSIGPDNYNNISINDTSYNLTFYLYSNNSILIYIRDETTNALITDNITITITYNTSENQTTTTNGTYFFEGLRDGNYSLKFSGSNYTTKSYAVTLADRSTQILTAYLSQNYESVIFTIRDSLTNAVIEGASFTMARLINSTWTTTESKSSDITGRVQVSYLPAIRYRFTVSASNYTSKVFYLDPVIFDSYNINLDPVISVELTQDYGEVNIVFYPRYFYDNQTNNFIWFITSPKGALTNYSVNITFPGGQQNRSGTNAIGEQFNINFNISGATLYDKVNITYTYDTTMSQLKTFRVSYGILGLATGNNTIELIKQQDYGLGLFEKLMISILAVLVLAGFTFMLAGSGAGMFVGMLVYGFFVYIGFLPLWSILITLLVGFILVVKLSSDV